MTTDPSGSTVPVEWHEPELRVDGGVADRKVKPKTLRDRRPVGDTGSAERIDAQPEAGFADGRHVDHRVKVANIGPDEIVGRCARARSLERHALYRLPTGRQQPIRFRPDPAGHVRVRRTSVGRVVLEAAVLGWVVRRGDHDPVRQTIAAAQVAPAPVVGEDRVRDHRGRRVPIDGIDPNTHVMRREHLQCRSERRLRQGVRVPADEQRAVRPLRLSVAADRLRRCDDVRLVERRRERRSAMARCPERDPLSRDSRIRAEVVVRADESLDIDKHRWIGRSASSLDGPGSGRGRHSRARSTGWPM